MGWGFVYADSRENVIPGCWIVIICIIRSVEIYVRKRDNFRWKIRAHTLDIDIVEGGGGRYPREQVQIAGIKKEALGRHDANQQLRPSPMLSLYFEYLLR